jgi:uncharacterized protein YaiI (UPF0178 family)
MKVIVDADACPVVGIVLELCRQYRLPCVLVCDTAHRIEREGAQTVIIDKGADSADFAIVNRTESGDLVVTQDYGLASMCLARSARVMHQDGWEYTPWNIDALLLQRHEARRLRAAGGRTKGPSKRKAHQDQAFRSALQQMLQQSVQG